LSRPEGASPGPFLNAAPLFHIGALSALLIALYSDQPTIFLPQFEPMAVLCPPSAPMAQI
jgi:hypothetical protein